MRVAAGLAAAFVCSAALATGPVQRTLSFDQRVDAQAAIERVYWIHREWPTANPSPKPPLSTVMPDEAIRERVENYLRESRALETVWQRPITSEQLQAELKRMAANTRDGSLLTELFDALGNDPFVIAETLARQTLADRLIRNWYAFDDRFHGALKRKAAGALAVCRDVSCMNSMNGEYHEAVYGLGTDNAPQPVEQPAHRAVVLDSVAWNDELKRLASRVGGIPDSLTLRKLGKLEDTRESFRVTTVLSQTRGELTTAEVIWRKTAFDVWWATAKYNGDARVDAAVGQFSLPRVNTSACVRDNWSPTALDAPDPGTSHTAVWTGTEMMVWSDAANAGSRYNPATDTWSSISMAGNPPARTYGHTAVWSGTEMIVWGGVSGWNTLNSGGRYNPMTDSWTATSNGTNAPVGRGFHIAVWTGTTMIVWGGGRYENFDFVSLNTGGRYDPATDVWTPTSEGTHAPTRRFGHKAVWTGTRMIVWGGYDGISVTNTGALYDPATDIWTATSTAGAVPEARSSHSVVWTGTEMIVWGGGSLNEILNTGGRYEPSTDSWSTTSNAAAPSGRELHTAVWTGAAMIVWGGFGPVGILDSGGIYDPSSNTWTPTGMGTNTPTARGAHTAVWTGTEMIVWGGDDTSAAMSTGGRYNPSTNSWIPTSTGTVPLGRSFHTAVWTGTEMIVWGGVGVGNSGGRYNPSTDTWMATSNVNAPAARALHTAVWTGTEMIVWGGAAADGSDGNDGGRYNPVTDSWAANGTGTGGPSPRFDHTAVWTGTSMIIWGGSISNNGGRYSPNTNSWTPVATANAPLKRARHTAIWSGSEMIVWGGSVDVGSGYTNTGGRYNPATNTWTATSTAEGVPQARDSHTAVWTGTKMIVWGGGGPSELFGGGGIYDPQTNTWTATSTGANTPEPRYSHTAVWTGAEMIIWGGDNRNLGVFNTGGRYDPSSDTWTATSTGTDVPFPRGRHSAVWTGTEMIVWGGGTATGGRYVPAASVVCNDNNPCTDDSCDPATGCVFANNSKACDDGNACSSSDTCSGGVCVGGAALDCNDNNPCTDDSCSPATGCVHTNGTGPCDDGDACTSGDSCGGGICNPGDSVVCDDNNVCTTDSCEPVSGCIYTNNTVACDDGSACTTNDICGDGTCHGTAIVCNDGNVCTTDTCNPATGCIYTNNTNACNDGNACTRTDVCANGTCTGSNPVVCGALDQCHVTGVCDPASGACSNPIQPNGTVCNDANLCTTGETCQSGTCTPSFSGLNEPNPRSSGYYKRLCIGPHSGDQLTDADAVCVGQVAATFGGVATVADLCAVLQPKHPNDDPCDRTSADLMVLALNICHARVCTGQGIDSQCGANGNVGQSLAESDAILLSPSRDDDTCAHAKCLDEEINTGRALELNSLGLRKEGSAIRLDWRPPYLDDGTGHPSNYHVWRRVQGSLAPFAKIGTTTDPTFLDAASGSGAFEYEITAVMN